MLDVCFASSNVCLCRRPLVEEVVVRDRLCPPPFAETQHDRLCCPTACLQALMEKAVVLGLGVNKASASEALSGGFWDGGGLGW